MSRVSITTQVCFPTVDMNLISNAPGKKMVHNQFTVVILLLLNTVFVVNVDGKSVSVVSVWACVCVCVFCLFICVLDDS